MSFNWNIFVWGTKTTITGEFIVATYVTSSHSINGPRFGVSMDLLLYLEVGEYPLEYKVTQLSDIVEAGLERPNISAGLV